MDAVLLFCALLFGVAFLFAAVGHGGASGYLALMALFNIAPTVMKPTALLLNLAVSTVAFIQFWRAGHFRWKLFGALALGSVPLSFLGGLLQLDALVYKKILGVLLLVPVVHFFVGRNVPKIKKVRIDMPVTSLLGAGIGFLSGLIGIGGGILLSPALLLLRWANQKETAAISALFIFVNSLAGLAGQWSRGIQFSTHAVLFVALAFAGGLLGGWLGARRLGQPVLQKILATVLLLAAVKLLFTTG